MAITRKQKREANLALTEPEINAENPTSKKAKKDFVTLFSGSKTTESDNSVLTESLVVKEYSSLTFNPFN